MPRSSTRSLFQHPAFSRRTAAFAALALVVIAGYLSAGPLNPPAGAVTGTGKTLAEVEVRTAVNAGNTPGDTDSLFVITAPGSYYLTGNITGVAGKHGIKIAPSNGGGITLDLGGFQISGAGGNGGVFSGVNVIGAATSITLINGTVRGWGGAGINCNPTIARNFRLSGISAINNVGIGIITPVCSNVSDCSAYGNTGAGISVNYASTVSNCRSASNGGAGITTLSCCTVTGCTTPANSIGINLGSCSRVTGCTARSNAFDGIRSSFSCTISGNICPGNILNGIHVTSDDTRVEGNSCTRGGTGIRIAASGNIIMKNTCTECGIDSWNIAANNAFGTIWDSAGNAYQPVNGFNGGGPVGSQDANANFTH